LQDQSQAWWSGIGEKSDWWFQAKKTLNGMKSEALRRHPCGGRDPEHGHREPGKTMIAPDFPNNYVFQLLGQEIRQDEAHEKPDDCCINENRCFDFLPSQE